MKVLLLLLVAFLVALAAAGDANTRTSLLRGNRELDGYTDDEAYADGDDEYADGEDDALGDDEYDAEGEGDDEYADDAVGDDEYLDGDDEVTDDLMVDGDDDLVEELDWEDGADEELGASEEGS